MQVEIQHYVFHLAALQKLLRIGYYIAIHRDRYRNYAPYSRQNNTFAVSLFDGLPINIFHEMIVSDIDVNESGLFYE